MTYTVWIVDRDPSHWADGTRLPIFWRTDANGGWIFRLFYRVWLVRS